MAMLHELLNQSQDKFVYTCNNCKGHVDTRYHCTVCDDFDLCVSCFEKDGHPHKMEKLGLDLDDGSSPGDQKQANPQDARKLSIQRCMHSFVHACQCGDANCRLPSCQKWKRVVQHTKVCKRKANGNCPICKQLIALSCYHAKYCLKTKCPVPFCLNIKHKMKQQQLQQRLQQAQLLRRRMAVMNTRGGSGSGLSGGSVSPVGGGAGPPGQLMGAAGGPQPPHPPIGLKPGSQTPPANVLQVVKHYEFPSKFASLPMLHELHNQSQNKFVYTCNNCKGHVETRYHCTICEDFDLCVSCFEKDGHPHKMEKLGLDLGDGSSPGDQKQANPQDARELSIQRCTHSFVHACQCRDANCRLPRCQKVKRVVQHTKVCERKANGNCPICKQLIALCCYHAKFCLETKCPVLFWPNLKHKMKQQQLQWRLQQAKLLRRRMELLSTRGRSGSGLSGGSVSPDGCVK